MHHDSLSRLIKRAMTAGAKPLSSILWEWKISGQCTDPVSYEITARPEANDGRHVVIVPRETKHTLSLRLLTRCRKCDKCRRARGRLWTLRAQVECRNATRTWFATFTFHPAQQYRILAEARAHMSQQGIDYDTLDYGDQFRQKATIAGRELTLFFKRLRKNSQAPLRYLLVAESHKSGNPHFHALIHETDPGYPVRHATLTKAWTLGFTKFKLVDGDPRAASYVCKYLSKSTIARVRASVDYGKTQIEDNSLRENRTLSLARGLAAKRRLQKWVDIIQQKRVEERKA